MNIEHDLPFEPRIIEDDEAITFPPIEEPVEPSLEVEEDFKRKKEKEDREGHPAFAIKEKYRASGHKVD